MLFLYENEYPEKDTTKNLSFFERENPIIGINF